MKLITILTAALLVVSSAAWAGYVKGYTKSDGTYVSPHYRSSPNGSVQDNYSYKGNVNPYTGSTGTNRYPHDTTSPYFNGTPNGNGQYGHGNGNGYLR